jgi:hypothetical protein
MGKYSVLILRGLQADVDKPEVVKRFNARDLKDGYDQLAHQKDMISWSRQHRERLGLSPHEDVIIQLFDHREGYELKEVEA